MRAGQPADLAPTDQPANRPRPRYDPNKDDDAICGAEQQRQRKKSGALVGFSGYYGDEAHNYDYIAVVSLHKVSPVLPSGQYDTPTAYPVYLDGPPHRVNSYAKDRDLYRKGSEEKLPKGIRRAHIQLEENSKAKAEGKPIPHPQPLYLNRGLGAFDYYHDKYPDLHQQSCYERFTASKLAFEATWKERVEPVMRRMCRRCSRI